MIDESIKKILNEKHKKNADLDFKSLLALIELNDFIIKERELTWPVGMATINGIYLDFNHLERFHDKFIFYIILHEIGHYKRILKFGKEKVINMLSNENFDEFCESVINEEIIADRYACYVYQILNKSEFPIEATQQLHLTKNKTRYRETAKELFGVINNSEENYNKLIESFLI